MAGTRKASVPMAEQIRLINECRKSGMTDADWCRENGIATVILRIRVRNKTSFPLTLYRILFRNNMSHQRCRKHTLTIHIRSKLL